MPFPSFFNRTPKPPPKALISTKVARSLTVGEMLLSRAGRQEEGEHATPGKIVYSFAKAISVNNPMCTKILKWLVKEFNIENGLFLLACEKYKTAPTALLFELIYSQFVAVGGDKQVNLGNPRVTAVEGARTAYATAKAMAPPGAITPPPLTSVFDFCIAEIEQLLGRDALARLKSAKFDGAFLMSDSQTTMYQTELAYLAEWYGINFPKT
jgi:hypothetical protein